MTKGHYELIQHNKKVLHAIISLHVKSKMYLIVARQRTGVIVAFLTYSAEADPDLQRLKSCHIEFKMNS